MLVAYLDEFGHVGPFVTSEHKKFHHHPLFGYAGIVLPEAQVRAFGARFEQRKFRMFRRDIMASGKHPRRWEKKGAELYTTGAQQRYPARNAQVLDLARYLSDRGGRFYFYGEHKPIGTVKETGRTPSETTRRALLGAVQNLCFYADQQKQNLLVLLDRGGPMPREEAITAMAAFIYSASSPEPMKRIIEVPMELESHRYGAMQFADWACAILSRASHYHFTESDSFQWAPELLEQLMARRTVQHSQLWLPEQSEAVKPEMLFRRERWLKQGNFGT